MPIGNLPKGKEKKRGGEKKEREGYWGEEGGPDAAPVSPSPFGPSEKKRGGEKFPNGKKEKEGKMQPRHA